MFLQLKEHFLCHKEAREAKEARKVRKSQEALPCLKEQ